MKKDNIYVYHPFSKSFSQRGYREKIKLISFLPSYVKMEHIGSTAVKDIGGKGIIDILIGVPVGKIQGIRKLLIKNKYDERSSSSKERFFFRKEYYYSGVYRRIHLHLTHIDSNTWKKALLFRNMLRKDKKLRKEYIALKKRAYKLCRDDGEICRNIKNKFIEKCLR